MKMKDMTSVERKEYERQRKRMQREKAKELTKNEVIGLRNDGENVCFANVIIQLLRPLLEFQQQLHNASSQNICVRNLEELFAQMNQSNGYVRGTPYFRAMNIPGYVVKHQYDSQEFLLFLLQEVYDGVYNTGCMFNIRTTSSITCGRNCLYACNLARHH